MHKDFVKTFYRVLSTEELKDPTAIVTIELLVPTSNRMLLMSAWMNVIAKPVGSIQPHDRLLAGIGYVANPKAYCDRQFPSVGIQSDKGDEMQDRFAYVLNTIIFQMEDTDGYVLSDLTDGEIAIYMSFVNLNY